MLIGNIARAPLPQVPEGYASGLNEVDAALVGHVACLARVSVPSVCFQLGGLAAGTAFQMLSAVRQASDRNEPGMPHACDADLTSESQTWDEQWFYVDQLAHVQGHCGTKRGAREPAHDGWHIQGALQGPHRSSYAAGSGDIVGYSLAWSRRVQGGVAAQYCGTSLYQLTRPA